MNSTIAQPESNFPLPAGFLWGTAEAKIKYANRKDVAIAIAPDGQCSAAAVFTQNTFAAAPVMVSREILQHGQGRIAGVVVNSGCANAATGDEGTSSARVMATTAKESARTESPFFVCSTGTIGMRLPIERIQPAIGIAASQASATAEAFTNFADAILTTDTRRKIASAHFIHKGTKITLLGCAKGAGMMQPNMATMLAYVFTDAAASPDLLQKCFSNANEYSLNCMTIDGDTSTNDSAMVFASGKSGVDIGTDKDALAEFEKALLSVLQSLAKQLARDGEGATKLVEIEVRGAPDFLTARAAAFKVGNSPLVKTAIYGRDANWGRIAMALGNAGLHFDQARVSIWLGPLLLLSEGKPLSFDEEKALAVLGEEFVRIEADLASGDGKATIWTCDFTERYIEINGSYRT
jgi:glutamate N-acetyltransferase / amino-acid N-acetyltransferase